MVNNTVVPLVKEKKQEVSCDENFLHLGLKLLCFTGVFPYEKVCNTPKKLKLFRAYQITLYVLYCPIFFSQFVKLYLALEDLQVAVETITHIFISASAYIITPSINWNEIYKLICKIDMCMPTKRTTQIDKETKDILREARKKYKFSLLFAFILGEVLLFCDIYDIFILHFVESIVGVQHKYKTNSNTASIFESLLLAKYPFSCWTPFDEKSITAHLVMYIYTPIPVLMIALKAGSTFVILVGTSIYTSLQFKFVNNSLEHLSNMEDPVSQIEQNTSSSLDKQHTFEERNDRNLKVSAADGEEFQTQGLAQSPENSIKHENTNTSITVAPCVKDQERNVDSDRPPSDNKLSSEDCLIIIIKNHQEAIS
jgi:hypothetical protein